jgi:hypothetical protein
MYLDANGDGINTAADVLSASGTTPLDIWLDTTHDRDGSAQTCNSHSGAPTGGAPLDFFSYTIVLQAIGGTVTWGTFAAADPEYTPFGTDLADAHDTEFNRARPAGTVTPPGLVKLGTIPVAVVSGAPSVRIGTSTPIDPSGFGTGFGTGCEGNNFLNTYVLATPGDPTGDWFDTDGVPGGGGGGSAPSLAAPPAVSSQDGGMLELSVTASDPDASDVLTVTASGLPTGFSSSPTSGSSPLTVHVSGRLPLGTSSSGPLDVIWSAADGIHAPVSATTEVSVAPTAVPDFGANFGYAAARLLVRFRPGAITASPAAGNGPATDFSFANGQTLSLMQTAGVSNLRRLLQGFNVNTTDVHGNPVTLPEDLTDLYVADLVDTSVTAAVAVLRGNSEAIEDAGPDFIGRPCGGQALLAGSQAIGEPTSLRASALSNLTPNDSLFSSQWWLRNTGQFTGGAPGPDIRATLAWGVTTGGSGSVDVGVLDTGIDAGHPDLQFVTLGPNFVGGATSDDDDPISRGTSNAGIIGAHGNNGIGVAGASWGPGLVAVKMIDASGNSTESIVLQAVDWARQNFIPIVFPNTHFANKSNNMAATFKNAHASGMLITAPTGVENTDTPFWPASFVNLVEGVGAIQEDGRRWDNAIDPFCPSSGLGSNFGQQLRLCAPGGNRIVTTRSRSTGSYYSITGPCRSADLAGTAGAGAAVAGTAALVHSMALQLSGEDLAQILERTTRDLGSPGVDPSFGYGLIEADAAVAFVNNSNVVDRGSTSTTQNIGIVGTPFIRFFNVPPMQPGPLYRTEQYEIRADILFGHPFVSAPATWGRNANSIGWRNHGNPGVRLHLEEPVGWCEVVPGSLTRTGCTLRTFFYKVFDSDDTFLGWFPSNPQTTQISLAWTAIGPANATGVQATKAPHVLRVAAQPNPVSYSGEFSLALPAASPVQLSLFRVNGSLVRRLANGSFPAGNHRVTWTAEGDNHRPLPTGLYFYRLTTNSGERSGKVLVIR